MIYLQQVSLILKRQLLLLLVLVFGLSGICVAWMILAKPVFEVSMAVAPTEETRSSVSGIGALSGLSGLASLAGVNLSSGASLSPFEEYLELIRSRQAANLVAENQLILQRMFPGSWNYGTRSWQAPKGIFGWLRARLNLAFGLPDWIPPSGESVQLFIKKNVEISASTDSPVRRLTIVSVDPGLAQSLLVSLHSAADGLVRGAMIERTNQQINYLERRLTEVQVAEHRAALSEILGAQERRMMLLQSGLSYAARVTEVPATPSQPTWPRPSLMLLGSIVVGFAVWVAIGLIRAMLALSIGSVGITRAAGGE